MIEIRNISKSYRSNNRINLVLNDISCIFPERQSIGIVGANGAGKSTLLRIIGLVQTPDTGDVIHQSRVSWPLGMKGGYSGALTGEENCRFVARIYNERISKVIEDTHKFSELGKQFFNPVSTYSAGMKTQFAIALALAIDFDFYLIDEITEIGDSAFRHKCRNALAERSDKSALILVSNNIRTIHRYCSKCAVLLNGQLQMYDSVAEAERIYKAI